MLANTSRRSTFIRRIHRNGSEGRPNRPRCVLLSAKLVKFERRKEWAKKKLPLAQLCANASVAPPDRNLRPSLASQPANQSVSHPDCSAGPDPETPATTTTSVTAGSASLRESARNEKNVENCPLLRLQRRGRFCWWVTAVGWVTGTAQYHRTTSQPSTAAAASNRFQS